jgi:hypothetical protein
MRKIIVVPAVFIGCLIVIWVGNVAAADMPSQELLAPTLTASAKQLENEQAANSDGQGTNTQNILAAETPACTLPAS